MTILKDCEIWFAKLDPKRPSAKFNKLNPTWEMQIRTTDKVQRKEWEALSLSVKAVVPDDGIPYWRANLKKKSIRSKEAGPAEPVTVVNAAREPLDPNSIGNGSIGNLRLFQYDYPKEDGSKGIASILMAVQLTKHIVYVAPPREDFEDAGETETVAREAADAEEGEDIPF